MLQYSGERRDSVLSGAEVIMTMRINGFDRSITRSHPSVVDRLSNRKIGDRLGTSEGTVKSNAPAIVTSESARADANSVVPDNALKGPRPRGQSRRSERKRIIR